MIRHERQRPGTGSIIVRTLAAVGLGLAASMACKDGQQVDPEAQTNSATIGPTNEQASVITDQPPTYPRPPEIQQRRPEIPASKAITRVLKEDSEGSNLLPFGIGDWHFESSNWDEIGRGSARDIRTIQVGWQVTNTTDKPLSLKTLGENYQFSLDTPIGQLLPAQFIYETVNRGSKNEYLGGDLIDDPNYVVAAGQSIAMEIWFETTDPDRNVTFEITDKVGQEKLLEFKLIPKKE